MSFEVIDRKLIINSIDGVAEAIRKSNTIEERKTRALERLADYANLFLYSDDRSPRH